MSPSLHKWLAAETRLADKGFSKAALNREEFPKLRGRNRIPVISKRDRQRFKTEKTEINKTITFIGRLMDLNV